MATSGGVKIPPDWLREPHFPRRSDLLAARKLEARQLALELSNHAHNASSSIKTRQFARSETIFRDSFRKSGAFDFSGQPPVDASQFHARATCSGLATCSAVLDGRSQRKHSESLKFEPQEIERLKDIPKADKLRKWWTQQRDGYVDDPSALIAHSLCLELVRRGLELGPMEPAKVRCPASVDERRQLQVKKAQLTDKVQHITHSVPAAHLKDDRAETATIARAPDLYAQERRVKGAAAGSSSGSGSAVTRSGEPLPAVFPLVSPIKVASSAKRSRSRPQSLAFENLFLESTSQRALLDQLKTYPPPSFDLTNSSSGSGGFARSRATNASSFALNSDHQQHLQQSEDPQQSPNQSTGKDRLHGTIRCGGFSR